MIKIKRIYEAAARADGRRILVDRLWPRGLKKEDAQVDEWVKELAPSSELRTWFNHEPDRWEGFKRRFFEELLRHEDQVEGVIAEAQKGTITLLFASKEGRYNNAVALKEFLEARMAERTREKAA